MSGKIQNLIEQANRAGNNENSVNFAKRQFQNVEKAKSLFFELKKDLLKVEKWNQNSSLSGFEVFEENGNISQYNKILEGIFLRISLTGSGKDDWVKILEIYSDDDEFIITVQPTFDPTNKNRDKTVISHFFTSESTNNFCVLST